MDPFFDHNIDFSTGPPRQGVEVKREQLEQPHQQRGWPQEDSNYHDEEEHRQPSWQEGSRHHPSHVPPTMMAADDDEQRYYGRDDDEEMLQEQQHQTLQHRGTVSQEQSHTTPPLRQESWEEEEDDDEEDEDDELEQEEEEPQHQQLYDGASHNDARHSASHPSPSPPPAPPRHYGSSSGERQSQHHRRRSSSTKYGNSSGVVEEGYQVKYSTTNGAGQWAAWQRNFESPLKALLDLFDNCVDSCFVKSDHGGASRRGDDYDDGTFQPTIEVGLEEKTNGLVLTNTCRKEVDPIDQVLTVNTRSKKDMKEQIGENGVGLKQACANLSDLSFVLIKSPTKYSLGILWKKLQTDDVCIPSIEFIDEGHDEDDEDSPSLEAHLRKAVGENVDEIGRAVERYGGGDVEVGLDRLLNHYIEMTESARWEDSSHVFRVVLHELRHGARNEVALQCRKTRQAVTNRERCKDLMSQLRHEVPHLYIHIPDTMKVIINGRRMKFRYWEHRLTQLTQFSIIVDKRNNHLDTHYWETDNYNSSTFATSLTELRVFCGFDSFRLVQKDVTRAGITKSKTGVPVCLMIHSRQSGRRLVYEEDARNSLGLYNGGTDFCQGLVVIVDDYNSTLPPTPTKQGIGFGKSVTGEIHKHNLYIMVGAVTSLYWKYYLEKFNGSKAALTVAVKESHRQIRKLIREDDDEEEDQNNINRGLHDGYFNIFEQKIHWRRVLGKYLQCPKDLRQSMTVSLGGDSLVNFKLPLPSAADSDTESTNSRVKRRRSSKKRRGSSIKNNHVKSRRAASLTSRSRSVVTSMETEPAESGNASDEEEATDVSGDEAFGRTTPLVSPATQPRDRLSISSDLLSPATQPRDRHSISSDLSAGRTSDRPARDSLTSQWLSLNSPDTVREEEYNKLKQELEEKKRIIHAMMRQKQEADDKSKKDEENIAKLKADNKDWIEKLEEMVTTTHEENERLGRREEELENKLRQTQEELTAARSTVIKVENDATQSYVDDDPYEFHRRLEASEKECLKHKNLATMYKQMFEQKSSELESIKRLSERKDEERKILEDRLKRYEEDLMKEDENFIG